jgi:Flp pilus assembly protein TadB
LVAAQEAARKQAEADLEEKRRQAEADLEQTRRQAEADLEQTRRQAEAELEEAKRQAQIELEKLEAKEPEPEIDESAGKLVPDLPPLQNASTLPAPVAEESNNMTRILIAVGAVAVIGLAAIFIL